MGTQITLDPVAANGGARLQVSRQYKLRVTGGAIRDAAGNAWEGVAADTPSPCIAVACRHVRTRPLEVSARTRSQWMSRRIR